MKSLVHAARIGTAVGAFALGFVGLTGTAAGAPLPTPFQVCSPLGCTVQSVQGTVERTGGLTRIIATVTDSSSTSSLTARFLLRGPQSVLQQVDADNESKRQLITAPDAFTELVVSACAVGPTPGCNTVTVPL
ncbi:hypothetical protein [Amycolatopsis azurea]|uniref:Uncharacterized protein n=1 Tax=Amycolatopsis azurea DSM 43854 TaxID=1238180 RepID=M2PWQ5_9PSEU|nr:hypothetical protein [Amycolatopsis azurea]EMD29053.1 hypothetical protein C791_6056 [Amycolatopsis azurea DSM 43854]OOC05220.1 hypothetical protein B0293_19885 [Amycolatopsis azurea DSM 43854]